MKPTRFGRSSLRPLFSLVTLSSIVSATLLLSCASSTNGGKSGGGKCFTPTGTEPAMSGELTAIEYPKSQVWVVADLSESATSEGLNKSIPFTLASENKRDVGAPGYATYRVTRGNPTLHETKEGIAVHVPIFADISVCKKIGSACIQYGSCKPSFLAKFSIGTKLDDQFALEPPEGTISATGKCVIGLDVTGQIEKIARDEVAKVEAQIKREWPQFKPEVKRAWKESEHPVPIAGGTCLHLNPDALLYQRPQLEKGKDGQNLTAAVGVTGTIEPISDCSSKQKAPRLPSPKVKKKIPKKSKIWIPEVLDEKAAQDDLKETLSGAFGEGRLAAKQVRLEGEHAYIQLDANGSICGSFWIQGKLTHVPGADALTLKQVAVVGSTETPPELTELLLHVEKSARVRLASADWFSDASLVPLRAGLRAAVPSEIEFDIKGLKAEPARVVLAEDGLYVLHPITARLVVTGF